MLPTIHERKEMLHKGTKDMKHNKLPSNKGICKTINLHCSRQWQGYNNEEHQSTTAANDLLIIISESTTGNMRHEDAIHTDILKVIRLIIKVSFSACINWL